ncbi:MAG: acyl--CoA ligase [Desulfurococcales archaeon]|nr:acyl--CoA ligase [Desulfurococcales archaeon]
MPSKPWLRVWPKGVPQSIEYPEEPVYGPVLEQASKSPSRCAVAQAESGTCYTYEKLVSMAKGVAAWLQARGAGPGSQVLYSAFNTVEAAAGLLGVWMSGASAVLVDPLTTSEDLQFQLEGRGIRLAVLAPDFYEREKGVLAGVGVEEALLLSPYHETSGAPKASTLGEALGLAGEWREPEIKPREDVGVVMYYSGIAGRTMQTLHTHFGALSSTIAYTTMMQLRGPPNSMVVAPLTHILGLQAGLLSSLYYGGTAVLMRRWNPTVALYAIASWGVNYLSGAPMMHEALLAEAKKRGLPPGWSLELGVSGGAPLKPEVQEEYSKVTGAPLVQLYGMTETWVVTFQPRHLAHVKATVGIPLPDVDAKIVDPESPTRELGLGETGELLIKAPWVMKGYEDEEENKRAFVDSWIRTGDLMVMDENGLLYFRGVRKRMIKYKAYPIFPRDLEIILEKHPAVEKAYVYGEPHPDYGHLPVAKVVLKPGYKGMVTPEELMDYVNSRVAFYKKIRKIEIVDKLP